MCFSLRIYNRETQNVQNLEQLKADWFFVALSLEMKSFRICKTFWRIQTKMICCIEDFKVFAGNWTLMNFVKEINPCRARSFRDGFAGLNTLSQIMENGFLWREPEKKICPARDELAFTVLLLYGFPSTHFSGFCVKKGQWKVSTWLTILPAPCFQVLLEFSSPSSTLKLDVNGWFIL